MYCKPLFYIRARKIDMRVSVLIFQRWRGFKMFSFCSYLKFVFSTLVAVCVPYLKKIDEVLFEKTKTAIKKMFFKIGFPNKQTKWGKKWMSQILVKIQIEDLKLYLVKVKVFLCSFLKFLGKTLWRICISNWFGNYI